MLKGINLSLILELKQLRKLDLYENCDFNKQITFAILSERPCRVPYDANKVRKDVLVVFQILYRCNICIEKENTRFAIAVTGHENDNTLSLWNASGGLTWTKTISTNKAIGISLIKRSSLSVVGQTVYFNPSNIVVDS